MVKKSGKNDENHELDLGFVTLTCYQCERECGWLAPDSRCSNCTGWTPAQIMGDEPHEEDI